MLQCLLVLAGTLCVPGVSAHTLGQTYLYMSINETELSARFEVTAADLNKGLGLALPEDGSLGEKQLALHEGRIAAYLKSKVRLTASGEPATLEFPVRHTNVCTVWGSGRSPRQW